MDEAISQVKLSITLSYCYFLGYYYFCLFADSIIKIIKLNGAY